MAYEERRSMRKEKGMKKSKMGSMREDSMFGFPPNCVVAEYPKTSKFNQSSDLNDWDVAGQDFQMDTDTRDLNKNKSKSRF